MESTEKIVFDQINYMNNNELIEFFSSKDNNFDKKRLKDRIKICKSIINNIKIEDLIKISIIESGCTFNFMKKQINKVKEFSKSLDKLPLPDINFKPKGKLLICLPSNETLESFFNSFIPAFIVGNEVFIKPSKERFLSAKLIYDACINSGIPKESLKFIPLRREQISYVIENRLIDAVYWTGGSETVPIIGQMCLNKGVSFVYESEGNDIAYLDDTAKIDESVEIIINTFKENNGMMCNAIRGLIVKEDIYEELIKKLKIKFNELKIGDPLKDNSLDFGKIDLVNMKYLDLKIKNLNPNKILNHPNNYAGGYPKIIIEPEMKKVNQEIFGPVLWTKKIKSLDEVIDFHKNNLHGLNFTLFSNDKEIFDKIIREIKVSRYNLNKDPLDVKMIEPWGGIKLSGESGIRNWTEKFIDKISINY